MEKKDELGCPKCGSRDCELDFMEFAVKCNECGWIRDDMTYDEYDQMVKEADNEH